MWAAGILGFISIYLYRCICAFHTMSNHWFLASCVRTGAVFGSHTVTGTHLAYLQEPVLFSSAWHLAEGLFPRQVLWLIPFYALNFALGFNSAKISSAGGILTSPACLSLRRKSFLLISKINLLFVGTFEELTKFSPGSVMERWEGGEETGLLPCSFGT